mgnify:FL=1
MDEDKLLEALAALEHEQWWRWALTVAQEEDISDERMQRWKKSMVLYSELTEENKEHDRIWARRVLEIVKAHRLGG